MTAVDPRLSLSYSDNDRLKVGDRLAAEIAENPSRLDVVSGYFTPAVWAAVGEALERVDRFRLIIGKDHELERVETHEEQRNVANLLRAALRQEVEPAGLARRQDAERVEELIAFLERHRDASEDEVVKLWTGDGFLHAKAYILAGSVGIGSANFTYPGLCLNRELVGWRQDREKVNEVEDYWTDEDAEPYTDRLIELLRDAPLVSDAYTPYDVLIRTLAARYGTDRPPSLEHANFTLEWFQEDAVIRLVRLLDGRARGALLADAVGLGKTYMAIGVIHHFLYVNAERRKGSRGRPVLLVVPAALEDMWRGVLERAQLDWACDLLTTQRLRGDFDPSRYAGADLIIFDEAHRLRRGGTWFHGAVDLVTAGERARDKRVLLLTATPVNTGMSDLVNLLRLLTKNDRGVWAPEIADFQRYLARVEEGSADPFPVLDRSIVRRSRSDVLEAYENARAAGQTVAPLQLPVRRIEHVDYDYGPGDEDLFEVFACAVRSLVLAPYDLERFRGERSAERLLDEELTFAPGSLAALYAAGLLTRFQSSLVAIRRSLGRLDAVLRRYGDALALDPPRLLDLQGSPRIRALLADEVRGGDHDADEELAPDEAGGRADDELERGWEAALAEAPALADAEEYRLDDLRAGLEHDRALIADLVARLPEEAQDGKLDALLAALRRSGRGRTGEPALAGRTVLIFSQFRDTARYVHRRLEEALGDAVRIDGGTPSAERLRITAFFDPERAAAAETATRHAGGEPPRILVSTDVLAEGHNLQIADCVINFDLHFNPQVAVQRAGRVDRLNSKHATVTLVSMLPPEDLDRHIGLLARLDERFRRIHGLGLGDERTMTLAGDVQGQTLEQIRRLYADDASVLDEIERSWTFGSTDYMRIPLATFLNVAGMAQLQQIPIGVYSVKRLPPDWRHGEGVFLAFAAPAPSGGQRDSYWRFYPRQAGGGYGAPLVDEVEVFRAIACYPSETRAQLGEVPPGPGVFDWDLVVSAAEELAGVLTLQRSQAELHRGASERSRKLRQELRANAEGLEVDGLDDLLDRLLQVRVEDFDGRSGWRPFDDARRALRRAETEGERFAAAQDLARRGLELLGAPAPDEEELDPAAEVRADDLQLVAYEALVAPAAAAARGGAQTELQV